MTKITLYKINSGFDNIPPEWSLDPWGMVATNGDAAYDFILPAGYRVAESFYDGDKIYAADGDWCYIDNTSKGPALLTRNGIEHLRRV